MVLLVSVLRKYICIRAIGFRPRRSLMFCSWGAEEYGLIGSVEYVQVSYLDRYYKTTIFSIIG